MIQLRIKQLCHERGIRFPLTTLKRAGISGPTAFLYLKGKRKALVVDHVEKLCKLLRCQPNDLFEWTPSQKADDYPENPLQVIRQKPSFNLDEKLKGMSLEEIRKKLG